jgi:hypothetical protein
MIKSTASHRKPTVRAGMPERSCARASPRRRRTTLIFAVVFATAHTFNVPDASIEPSP